MTFLTVVQGKNCALLVSDLQLLHCPPEQVHLSEELRQYEKYMVVKFRPNLYGDYIAFHGRMNEPEHELFHRATLSKLEHQGLQDSRFRADNRAILFYAKRSTGQVYQGTSDSKLTPLGFGQISAACSLHDEYALELTKLLRGKFDSKAKFNSRTLKELSDIAQGYYLEKEKTTNSFGGFVSHIIRPNEFITYRKIPGKLKGLDEIIFAD